MFDPNHTAAPAFGSKPCIHFLPYRYFDDGRVLTLIDGASILDPSSIGRIGQQSPERYFFEWPADVFDPLS